MILSEAQDLVRSKIGIPDLDPFQLSFFLAGGRQELETRGNYYYMHGIKDHTLVASQGNYNILNATTNGLNLPNFKEHWALFIRDVGGTQWLPVPVGAWDATFDEFTTAEGKPRTATVANDVLYMFPTPDDAYPIKLVYFDWTTNPADVSTTDELLTRWSQALIYASIMVGKRFVAQNPQAAPEWEAMMKEQCERLKAFTNDRLKSPVNIMSAREAAQILQAGGGGQ